MKFSYYLPTRIEFGVGVLNRVGEEAKRLGSKALIVMGKSGSMKKAGVLDRVLRLLKDSKVEAVIFDKIQPNPTAGAVDEGAKLARSEKCDLVIGLGGGSSIDSAKCIAFMAKSPGKYWDYVQSGSGGRKIPKEALPIVAIPSTAGTGTEADPFAVITNQKTKEKPGIGYQITFPEVSLVDPELTLTVPKDQTAYTGMDAFFHALEAYVNINHQPAADLLALEAIRLITKYLPVAYKNGGDLEARTQLAWASTAAGICETLSGCIGLHSLEHPVSGHYESVPHGAGLAAIGPVFFEHIMPHALERLAKVAQAISEDTSDLSLEEQARGCIKAICKLRTKIGLKDLNLRSLEVKEDMIPRLAEDALQTMGALIKVTPGELKKDDLIKIYHKAMDYKC